MLHTKSEEEKYKLERKAYFNFGERINKMISTKIKAKDLKEISIFENKESDEVNIVYFGSLNGSIGVIIQLNKEIFEFLKKLEEIIISKTYNNGNFDYKKWRSFKDGFISYESNGFVEGNILEDFLNFDDDYRKKILKELNYPWQKNINDVINIIETLVKYH
jgi:DNA damage-binding protein 1